MPRQTPGWTPLEPVECASELDWMRLEVGRVEEPILNLIMDAEYEVSCCYLTLSNVEALIARLEEARALMRADAEGITHELPKPS